MSLESITAHLWKRIIIKNGKHDCSIKISLNVDKCFKRYSMLAESKYYQEIKKQEMKQT